jgi:cyclic pyranopterin phosphate synthase
MNETRDAFQRPLRDLRISVMDRCNFRCSYCMPRETYHADYQFLRAEERLDLAEIVRLAGLFAKLGVRKLRLTGGEPLLYARLSELIRALAVLPGIEDVALTTNGTLLAAQARQLKAAGLHRVTVSLDSLDPEVFRRMSGGVGHPDRVLAGIEQARSAGLDPVKVNTVVQRGVNDDGVLDLVERFRSTGVSVRFIEYMDVGNRNQWHQSLVVPSAELVARISRRWPLLSAGQLPGGEVAQRYMFADGQGEVGFVSSVSQPFCGACSRARLSSDGALYTCLFASRGTSLRSLLRAGVGDDELIATIARIWQVRSDHYSEQRGMLRLRKKPASALDMDRDRDRDTLPKVEMNYIGG